MKIAVNGWFDFVADWRPIAEAPVAAHNTVPSHYSYRCIVQLRGGYVTSAEAQWRNPSGKPRKGEVHKPVIKWFSATGLCDPVFFMPLPPTKKD